MNRLRLSLLPLMLLTSCISTIPTQTNSSSSYDEQDRILNLVHEGIQNNEMQSLDSSIVSSTASKTLNAMAKYLKGVDSNYVLSPASYLLAVSGLVSVSDGFDNSKFGFGKDS